MVIQRKRRAAKLSSTQVLSELAQDVVASMFPVEIGERQRREKEKLQRTFAIEIDKTIDRQRSESEQAVAQLRAHRAETKLKIATGEIDAVEKAEAKGKRKHEKETKRLLLAHKSELDATKRKHQERLLALREQHRQERIRLKYSCAHAPGGFRGLKLAFKHLRTFWQGGVEAAFEAERPLIRVPEYRVAWKQSLGEYLIQYFSKPTMHQISWMGVKTLKCINDLWIYQEIIHRQRPDVIVEIGSYAGGSTLYLANLLDLIGHGEIISVDICRDFYNVEHPRIHTVTGDCSAPETIAQIREIVNGQTVMVIHDGDHSYDAVLRDLEIYAPMVGEGQYIVVEDGLVDIFNRDRYKFSALERGPLRAVETFMKRWETQFEIDTGSERFILTANPKGFLRRKAG